MFPTRWSVLLVLFLVRTAIGVQFQSVGSAGQPVLEELGISASALGTLIGLFVLPGCAVALSGGALASRIADRTIVLLALLIMASASAVIGLAPSFEIAATGRLMGGVGFALLTVALAKMTVDWFAGRELMAAMGILLASWPAGVALGLWVQPRVADAFGWRVMMGATGGFCLVLMLVAAFYRPPPHVPQTKRAAAQGGALTWAEGVASLLAGLAWGGVNLGTLIFFSFTPRLLESAGMSPIAASTTVSWGMWFSALAVPLGGILAERLAAPIVGAVMACAIGAVALGLVAAGIAPAFLAITVGVAVGAPAAIIVALPGRVLSSAARGPGLGIFYATFFLEAAVGPFLAGSIETSSQSVIGAIWLGASALASSAVGLCLFTLPQARRHAAAIA
jgi:predicted MFS family arabinose efflux permease